jgi:hypothetical protein
MAGYRDALPSILFSFWDTTPVQSVESQPMFRGENVIYVFRVEE